jgi:hypothetical protein
MEMCKKNRSTILRKNHHSNINISQANTTSTNVNNFCMDSNQQNLNGGLDLM